MRHRSIASSLLVMTFAAHAADLTGRFVSEENSLLGLQLEQRTDGSVTGYFSSPSGPVAVSAQPSGKELRGTMRAEDGTFEIRLRPEGNRVLVRFMSEPGGKLHPFRRAEQPPDEGVVAKGSREPAMPVRSPGAAPERVVIVNGKRLSAAQLEQIERTYRVQILPADYWYDRMTGAWGIRGGPTLGFVLPNVDLGGPLAADASGGGTQVFINGRELHPVDVANLQRCLPMGVQRGRYWVSADGTGGYESGPPMFNLVALCRQAQGGSGAGGSWGTEKTRLGVTGITTTGDGDFGMSVDGKYVMRP